MIFVDTGFLVAALDPRDSDHELAMALRARYILGSRVTFLTTRDVLNEVLAHFSRGSGDTRVNAVSMVRRIRQDDRWRVINIDEDGYDRALMRYENRPDKRYSMVDCIGMTVMDEAGVREVLATDADFAQEGYLNLMRLAG